MTEKITEKKIITEKKTITFHSPHQIKEGSRVIHVFPDTTNDIIKLGVLTKKSPTIPSALKEYQSKKENDSVLREKESKKTTF